MVALRATDRSPSLFGTLALLLALVGVAFVLHLGLGSSSGGLGLRLTPWEVVSELFRGRMPDTTTGNDIIWLIRLPRALGCLLAGGLLGVVGSAFQSLFRNPLADPFIVGVSSGSAVGGALAILLGFAGVAAGLGLLAASFVCGMLSLGLVFSLATRKGAVDVQTLLLSGVVVGAMLSAVLALLLMAGGLDANQVLRWLLGSATPMYWPKIYAMAVALLVGGALLLLQSKSLNALSLGEHTAQRLGVDTRKLKPTVLVTGTAMTAVCVGSVGIIGFLGLVAPHIARRVVGVDWRRSLAGSALIGMSLLLCADVVAQWGLPGGEVPVGVVTALLGAPFLLVLLRRES